MKLKHPEAKGTIEVGPQYVDMYQSQGWVKVKVEPAAKPADDDKSKK